MATWSDGDLLTPDNMNQKPSSGTELNVQAFNALPDGSTDVSAEVQNTIDELPDGGGTIIVPPANSHYILDGAALNPGSKRIIIKGGGWKCLVGETFGNSNWDNSSGAAFVNGSVLRFLDSTQDGIKITTSDNYRGLMLRDVALVGPGAGTTYGINAGTGDNNNELKVDNVLVANFGVGWRQHNSFDNEFRGLMIRSCGTVGLEFSGTVTDTWFYGLNVQGSPVGLDITGDGVNPMAGVHSYGGLIQGDTIGIRFNENAAVWSFDGLWIECGAGTKPLVFNAVDGPISDISFINCRCSDTWTLSTAASTILTGSAIAGIRFRDCYMAGTTVVLDSTISDFQAMDTVFAAFNPNGASRVVIRDRNSGLSGESITSYNIGNISAGSFAPDWRNGTRQHGTITGNLTVDVPTNAPADIATLEVLLRQDSGGGNSLTAGANISGPALDDTGNTANTYTILRYRRLANSGSVWIVEQVPYFA